jgi:rod shape determining protein RodA
MTRSIKAHIIPLLMLTVPTGLVMHQPDLGTALLLLGSGGALIFLAGISWKWVLGAMAAAAAAIPAAFMFVLHEYQRERILTFLDPDRDPLGASYHVTQSKIAIGNGGLTGQGFMQGSQAQLDFLPENHTDFIFSNIAEEFGLIGALFVLTLYVVAMGYAVGIARGARTVFGQMVAAGMATVLFLYVSINALMIMGLAPVVGVPMPLLSFGGTAMLTIMVGFGLVLNVQVHRDQPIGAKAIGF